MKIRPVAMAFAMLAPLPVLAEDVKVMVELNKLETEGSACQAYILLQNKTETAFENLALDLVMFDPDGIIARRLAVEMAPLRAGKTSVKVFGIDGLTCEGIGRVLVNDVLSCTAGGAAKSDCLGLIETVSRGPVELIN
ncbi:MAG: Tat pathway signal sequence domain protein [Pseudomonadota bacterium]